MVSVPDAPAIVLPASPVLEEDTVLVIEGLGLYDADVSRPGDEGLLFNVWLEAVSGRLSLNSSSVSLLSKLLRRVAHLQEIKHFVVFD